MLKYLLREHNKWQLCKHAQKEPGAEGLKGHREDELVEHCKRGVRTGGVRTRTYGAEACRTLATYSARESMHITQPSL